MRSGAGGTGRRVQGGAVVDDARAPVGQPAAQLGGRRVVVREVDGDHVRASGDRADLAQPAQLLGEGHQVEVVGAVGGQVTERLLEQHHVVRRVTGRGHGRLRQRTGVGGVEQPAARTGHVVQHARPLGAVPRGEHSHVVVPDPEPVPGRDGAEPDRGVRGDPHPGLGDHLGGTDHVQRRPLVVDHPRPEQQEGGRAVVRVRVGQQHVPQPGEVQPGTLRGVRGLRTAVEQQRPVEQRGGLRAQRAGATELSARRAAAVRVGPAVGGAAAEQGEVHSALVNTATASKAARRDARRRARSSAVPASSSTSPDRTERPRSHGSDVVR